MKIIGIKMNCIFKKYFVLSVVLVFFLLISGYVMV